MPQDRHSSASAYSQREERRLGVRRLVEQRRRRPRSSNSTSSSGRRARRPAPRRSDRAPARNAGCVLVELAAHAGVLRALAGEQERDARRVGPRHGPRRARAPSSPWRGRPEPARASSVESGAHRRAMRADCARPTLAREGDVGQAAGSARTPAGAPSALRARRASARCAPTASARARRARDRGGRRRGGRRLLEDDVGVGAAEAERADAGDAAARRAGHGVRLRSTTGRAARPRRCAGWAARSAGAAGARRAAAPAPP